MKTIIYFFAARMGYIATIRLYLLCINVASLFSEKARLWRKGRKGWRKRLQQFTQQNHRPVMWIHSASLGEFEQARPLITAFKKRNPTYAVVCTFFSPSGYEIRKNYADADYVAYLPIDTKVNAQFWLDNLQPTIIFWVKYDFWVNFLNESKKRNVPIFLFSAVFRENQVFFGAASSWWKNRVLDSFTHLFVQNKKSHSLLQSKGIQNVSVAYDTRFDRVWENAQQTKEIDSLLIFKGEKKLLVAGSTWQPDEDLLIELTQSPVFEGWKLVLVPHEVDPKKIAKLMTKIKSRAVKFSEDEATFAAADILVVDSIGQLSKMYASADMAYLGGGFGAGIHNIVEAMVFGIGVVIGPKYQKFVEAVEAVEAGGAISICDCESLKTAFLSFSDKKIEENKTYVAARRGGSRMILDFVEQEKLI